MNFSIPIIPEFVGLIILLYFLSRKTFNGLYYFFNSLIKSRKVVYWILCILFLPGTFIHELAHFVMAKLLFLKVVEFSIWPEFQGNSIKMGRVLYHKTDIFRGTLVGVAPVIVGLILFWLAAYFKVFPSQTVGINILFIYILFVVSGNMFSSRADLVDAVYVLPLLAILFFIGYSVHIAVPLQQHLFQIILSLLPRINSFLLLAVGIHFGLLVILQIIQFIKR